MLLAGTRLGRTDSGGGLLAAELDPTGRADGLSVFSAMVGLRARRGCARDDTDGHFDLDSVTKGLRAPICGFFARMVAI